MPTHAGTLPPQSLPVKPGRAGAPASPSVRALWERSRPATTGKPYEDGLHRRRPPPANRACPKRRCVGQVAVTGAARTCYARWHHGCIRVAIWTGHATIRRRPEKNDISAGKSRRDANPYTFGAIQRSACLIRPCGCHRYLPASSPISAVGPTSGVVRLPYGRTRSSGLRAAEAMP